MGIVYVVSLGLLSSQNFKIEERLMSTVHLDCEQSSSCLQAVKESSRIFGAALLRQYTFLTMCTYGCSSEAPVKLEEARAKG